MFIPATALVQARIDPATRDEAAVVLASMGMTVSQAVRLMLIRIAEEKALPFSPLVPNETTIAAMREAMAGGLPRFDSVAAVLEELGNDRPLTPARLTPAQKDHPPSGTWTSYRDCHIKPDLVLIFKLPDDDTLTLVRLGSHSELGIS